MTSKHLHTRLLSTFLATLLCFAAPLATAEGLGSVTVLLDSAAKSLQSQLLKALSPASVVAVDDIYSLTLTVTQVSMRQYDSGDKKLLSNSVVVFSGEQDVDLVSLEGLPEILATADIPAGGYDRITLAVENPRLRLAANASREVSRVKIAGGEDELVINSPFFIPADDSTLILLTLNDFHLVRKYRNGDTSRPANYVLSPRLDVDVSVTSADVTVTGEIAALDKPNDTLVLAIDNGDVTVVYSGAKIFLPTDRRRPNGHESDLQVGARLKVVGTLDISGVVTASALRLR